MTRQDDGYYIRLIRHLVPSFQPNQCGSYNYQITNIKTWRSPGIAYDSTANRIVLVYNVRDDIPRIAVRTMIASSYSFTSPIILDEWTDAPVGIACGYWSPSGTSKCWIAFPVSHAPHYIRLCRGYINQYGDFVKETCQTNTNYQSGNTRISVAAYSNSVVLLYTGLNNARNLNKITIDSNWNWSNEVYDARSPTGPGMDSFGNQIHAGFNE